MSIDKIFTVRHDHHREGRLGHHGRRDRHACHHGHWMCRDLKVC
jgi:hypothetical protein